MKWPKWFRREPAVSKEVTDEPIDHIKRGPVRLPEANQSYGAYPPFENSEDIPDVKGEPIDE